MSDVDYLVGGVVPAPLKKSWRCLKYLRSDGLEYILEFWKNKCILCYLTGQYGSIWISKFKCLVNFSNIANISELSRSDGAQMFIACWPTNTHLRLAALPQNRALSTIKEGLVIWMWNIWWPEEKSSEKIETMHGRAESQVTLASRSSAVEKAMQMEIQKVSLQMLQICLVRKLLGKMMDSPAINFTRG